MQFEISHVLGIAAFLVSATGGATAAVMWLLFDRAIKQADIAAAGFQDGLIEATRQNRILEADKSDLKDALESVHTKQAEHRPPDFLEILQQRLRDPDFDLWNWSAHRGDPPSRSNTLPIVTILNLKGGVGKTTLASCLSSYLALKKQCRVLLIDIDYQGSLTSNFRRAWVAKNERMPTSAFARGAPGFWLQESTTARDLVSDSFNIDSLLPDARLLEADYPLFQLENRLYLQWAIEATGDDVRYRLARLLHGEEVKKRFDFVVIDAPPRLSLAAVNAMFASTHFVVPTILDRLSIEPIRNLIEQTRSIFPAGTLPRFAGALPTLTSQMRLSTFEQSVRADLDSTLRDLGFVDSVFACHVPRKAALAKLSGARLPYVELPIVREIFDPVCAELVTRVQEAFQCGT